MIAENLKMRLRTLWNSRTLFLKMLMLQPVFLVLVLFDIPIVRQVFVFLYLTLVPGFIILKVLKFKELSQLEIVLFSVGFSIAFLMIGGLLINELGLMIGIQTPLSEIPLLTVLNIVVLLFSLTASNVNAEPKCQAFEIARSVVKTPFALLFLCLPVLSLVGSIWNNAYANNSVLLLMIVSIALLFATSFLSKKLFPPKLYSFAVLMIAISLLFHRSLVSNYVQAQGSDAYFELAVFRNTQEKALWNPVVERFSNSLLARYNDMVSLTVFPTILSNLMNMDPVWVIKILYPLFFSFVPLALFRLWEKHLGTKIAFISAFFFMAEQTFYMEMLALSRQMIAELFFSLLIIVVLTKEIKSSKKVLCFTIFGTALIVSHYAMSLLFLVFLLSALILSFLMKRRHALTTKITLVVLFSVLMFSWYIYTARSAAFDSILQFTSYVFEQTREWYNPASRGAIVLRGLGIEASPSIWNSISRGFAYSLQFLIGIGFLSLIIGKEKIRLDREYFGLVLPSIGLLAALILIPGLATTLNMTRFYHILLFFLAPLAVLGGESLAKVASQRRIKIKGSMLLLVVLIPYFLFQTNFVYEVANSDSWSLPLSAYRMNSLQLYANYLYIDEQSLFGCRWLSENSDLKSTTIYADLQATTGALTYTGLTFDRPIESLSNATIPVNNATIYFNPLNILGGIVVGQNYQWNSSELSFLNNLDLIYSNGACEIYKRP